MNNQVNVVEEKDGGEEESCEMDAPEEYVELDPGRVHPSHNHYHREDET